MLLDGEIDAAILGDVAEEGPLKHLIPDHAAEGQRWARAHGGVPINHIAVIRQSIAESRPDVVREVYRVLKESRAAAALPTGVDDPLRFGVAATRASLEQMAAYAFQQGLISRRPTADELFADAARILGAGSGVTDDDDDCAPSQVNGRRAASAVQGSLRCRSWWRCCWASSSATCGRRAPTR